MRVHHDATTATDEVLYFDHVVGEVYKGQPRMTVDPPEGPLSRIQGRLQHSDRYPVVWVGNRVSDFRFWMWRLIR